MVQTRSDAEIWALELQKVESSLKSLVQEQSQKHLKNQPILLGSSSMSGISNIGSHGPVGSTTLGSLYGGLSHSGHPKPCLGQYTGSRINSYKCTSDTLEGPGYLMSISAMSCYECKSHEELRWEDYELKSVGHSIGNQKPGTNKTGFIVSLPSTTSSFKTQSPPSNTSSLLTTMNTPTLSFPSLSNPSSSSDYSALHTKSPFSGFGINKLNDDSSLPSITSSLSTQCPSLNFPSFSTNMNTPTLSIPPLSSLSPNPFACNTKSPSTTGPCCDQIGASALSNQPLQNLSLPSSSNVWSQAPSPLIKLPVPSENNGGALLNIDPGQTSHSQQVKDSITAVKDPFGSESAAFQPSIGHFACSSLVRHGISSMPVADNKPAKTRVSSVLTSRHRSRKPLAVSVRRYHSSKDVPKIMEPFFERAEDLRITSKAYSYIVQRENPRSVFAASSKLIDASVFNKEASPPHHAFAKEYDQVSDNAMKDQISNSATKTLNAKVDYKQLIPKFQRSDYYTEPKIEKLASIASCNTDFCCQVKEGRHGYGRVKFYGETDVRGLDLDTLIQFNNQEVIVYGEDVDKPPVGQGLNKAAEVTLLNIKCFDKKIGKYYTRGKMVESFIEKLKKVTEKQGAEFVSYDPSKEEWKFRVQHF